MSLVYSNMLPLLAAANEFRQWWLDNIHFQTPQTPTNFASKVKLDTCGLQKPWHKDEVNPCQWAFLKKETPLSLSTGFWSIKFSYKPRVSNHFRSWADIRYQSPFTNSLDLACAGKISAAVRGLLTVQSVWLSFGTAEDSGSHKRSVWTFPSSRAIPFPPSFPQN